MKKIFILFTICQALVNAYQYNVYDMNGKKQGSFYGIVDKNTLARIIKEYHSSILVKKGAPNEANINKFANLNQHNLALTSLVDKNIDITKDSLVKNLWFEVEKNEIVKICLNSKVSAWETLLDAQVINDSCLIFQASTLIGTEVLKIYLPQTDTFHKVNLAVGMKYLDFKNEDMLLGSFDLEDEDPKRLISVNSTYLVDKYPVTNCEITQQMWDNIPSPKALQDNEINKLTKKWINRKYSSIYKDICPLHDSATSTISLYQALKYANKRSISDGLKPFYKFSTTQINQTQILSKGQYIISYFDFSTHKDSHIQVSVDYTSDGYRLPFYDEWMMLARGGDKKNDVPWDKHATDKEIAKYAKFGRVNEYDETGPVGQLKPNGYGLYDIFGLVKEHVLFEQLNPFNYLLNIYSKESPSCFKGGSIHDNWENINYGYISPNYHSTNLGGFRLIRKIK